MNFGNFIKSFVRKFFDKSLVKINIDKKLKKNEIAYSTARKQGLFREPGFRLDNAQRYILKCIIKIKVVIFFV